MSNTATAAVEQPATESLGLPNKFIYPEFAGFAGEDLLHEIVTLILPVALLRTWEIFERKHAYGSDCYQSLGTVTKKANRTQRTINRHIAIFMARGLLIMRPEQKLQSRMDGSTYKKAVVVKDFSGLYALAHEYYEWQYAEDYLLPEYENLEHIQNDPRLVAKLCRFENYRRLLEHHRDPFAQVQEDRRFTEYRADSSQCGKKRVEDAKSSLSGRNGTKLLPKEPSNEVSKVSQNDSNEKAYSNSQNGDSFDSGKNQEIGREAGATPTSITKTGARGYTKQVRGYEMGTPASNEFRTNPVPPCPKNVLSSSGKTRVSAEKESEVQSAQGAMAAFGIVPGRSARHQVEELPPPAKHPLARSFVHVISAPFGDRNEKGSKTGVERTIETFELVNPRDVLLCLMRAFVVAKLSKIKKENINPETGIANRMRLFCFMFKEFARACASGSKWDYSWEQMLADLEADDLFAEWWVAHQGELVGDVIDQAGTTDISATVVPEAVVETGEEPAEAREAGDVDEEQPMSVTSAVGWKVREKAYDWAIYLVQQLAENGYSVEIYLGVEGERYQIVLTDTAGTEFALVSRGEVEYVVALVRGRGFSIASIKEEITMRRALRKAEGYERHLPDDGIIGIREKR